jgi:hypothetical protein
VGCNFPLQHSEIHWLGYSAFAEILSRKPTAWKRTIDGLKRKLAHPKYHRCAEALQPVTQPAHSAAFATILL